MMIMKSQNLMIKMIKIKKQQTNNIDTKPSNIFNYLKSLSQKTEDLMYEIEEENDDREKFNFNTFRIPLNFLSAICNGKISLKEAEFKQRDLEKEIEEPQFYYITKNKGEKEEKSQELMHAKELLESRNEIIKAFKDDIFPSEHFKKLDDATNDFTLENVSLFRKLDRWTKN